MKDGMPSVTAMFVAFARAVGSADRDLAYACRDEPARSLVPRPLRKLLERAEQSSNPGHFYALFRAASMGVVDHVALRTAVIDEALRDAIARGAQQLVVLGAGFDSRAHRVGELSSCTVFEVDHPSTQALKQKKSAHLARTAREIRYVPCDFERVSLEQALERASFDVGTPSAWIWEGVTMYLESAAIEGTISTMARKSPACSTLIASYLTPRFTSKYHFLGRLGVESLRYLSEPVRTISTPEEMRERLARHGLSVLSDVLPSETATRYRAALSRYAVAMPDERIVVAIKG